MSQVFDGAAQSPFGRHVHPHLVSFDKSCLHTNLLLACRVQSGGLRFHGRVAYESVIVTGAGRGLFEK